MLISEKIRMIRVAERLTQVNFCEITHIALGTLKRYEGGQSEPSVTALLRITRNHRFKKYALWLTTDETAPEVGQIAPPLSPDGYENSEVDQVSIETTQKSPR